MLHGQLPGGGGGAAMRNDQVYGVIALPAVSRADTATVNAVPAVSGAAGVTVAVREVASYAVAPATVPPAASRTEMLTVAGWTGSSNVALGRTVVATLALPAAGVTDATVGGRSSGGAVVVNTGSTQ